MARSKNYLTYPDSFHEFIRQAATHTMVVECADQAKAYRLMGRMYGFFSALEKACHEKETPEEIRTLRRMSTKVKLKIDGSTFIAYPADEEPINMLVAKAVAAQSEGTTVAEAARNPSPGLLHRIRGMMKSESEKDDHE